MILKMNFKAVGQGCPNPNSLILVSGCRRALGAFAILHPGRDPALQQHQVSRAVHQRRTPAARSYQRYDQRRPSSLPVNRQFSSLSRGCLGQRPPAFKSLQRPDRFGRRGKKNNLRGQLHQIRAALYQARLATDAKKTPASTALQPAGESPKPRLQPIGMIHIGASRSATRARAVDKRRAPTRATRTNPARPGTRPKRVARRSRRTIHAALYPPLTQNGARPFPSASMAVNRSSSVGDPDHKVRTPPPRARFGHFRPNGKAVLKVSSVPSTGTGNSTTAARGSTPRRTRSSQAS